MSAEPEPPEPPRVNEPTADAMTPQEVLGWAEFCCWSALVMTPLIWWLQGPSVSTDQFVVRTALVVISATGGIALRFVALRRKRRAGRAPT